MGGLRATVALLLVISGATALRPTVRLCRRSLLGRAAALTLPLGTTLPSGARAAGILAERKLPEAELEDTTDSAGESTYETVGRGDDAAAATSSGGDDSASRLALLRERFSLMLDEQIAEQVRRLVKILHWYKHDDVLH